MSEPETLDAEGIEQAIKDALVAVAVWLDPISALADENGICMIVIKGERALKRAIRIGKAPGGLATFRVPDMSAAQNMRDLYGDVRRSVKGMH